ncbi:hypothetical protein C8R44DRAFT_728987 [Mycena epipterygia]|nr:hypothetical protein C8R44DRAFT_728987 [Mycena epipterygia]
MAYLITMRMELAQKGTDGNARNMGFRIGHTTAYAGGLEGSYTKTHLVVIQRLGASKINIPSTSPSLCALALQLEYLYPSSESIPSAPEQKKTSAGDMEVQSKALGA